MTAFVVATTQHAHAEVRVERSSEAASCPDTAALLERVRDGEAPAAHEPLLIVRFHRTPTGFRASIASNGTERSLDDDATSCEGLAEATAVAVKLALDSAATPGPPAPTPPTLGETPSQEPSRPTAAPAEPRKSLEIGARAVLLFGLIDPVAPGAHVGASFVSRHRAWSIGVTGLVLPTQTRALGEGAVDTSAIGGGVEGCARFPAAERLAFGLCARAEVLRLAGHARGYTEADSRARALFTGAALGRVAARIAGPVSVTLEAGAVVPFVRERFAIEGAGVAYEPPIVAAMAGTGLLVDFR